MIRSRSALVAALVAATSIGALGLAKAETKSNFDQAVSATKPRPGKNPDITQISQEGFSAMRAVQAARIAIFDGNTKLAADMAKAAQDDLAMVRTIAREDKAATIVLSDRPDELANPPRYAVIDATIGLVDNYVATPEKQASLKKANEHFAKGDHKSAIEELRLHDIDVTYTRYAIPIDMTFNHVEQAVKLMGEQKFYEASLALKAVSDSVTADTVSFAKTVG